MRTLGVDVSRAYTGSIVSPNAKLCCKTHNGRSIKDVMIHCGKRPKPGVALAAAIQGRKPTSALSCPVRPVTRSARACPIRRILVTAADTDDRVVPGLQLQICCGAPAVKLGDKPRILGVDERAGYGAGKPTSKAIDGDDRPLGVRRPLDRPRRCDGGLTAWRNNSYRRRGGSRPGDRRSSDAGASIHPSLLFWIAVDTPIVRGGSEGSPPAYGRSSAVRLSRPHRRSGWHP